MASSSRWGFREPLAVGPHESGQPAADRGSIRALRHPQPFHDLFANPTLNHDDVGLGADCVGGGEGSKDVIDDELFDPVPEITHRG
jgi:hypothetical protein